MYNQNLDLSKLKTGDIILFRTEAKWNSIGTWISPIIRFMLKSYYNHCGIVINNWNQLMLNESIESGIIGNPILNKIYERKIKILRSKTYSPNTYDQEKEIAIKANSKLGTKYDYLSIFLFLPIYIITKNWVGRIQTDSENKMFCSEYVAWIYSKIFNNYWEISPEDINKNYDFEIIYETK